MAKSFAKKQMFADGYYCLGWYSDVDPRFTADIPIFPSDRKEHNYGADAEEPAPPVEVVKSNFGSIMTIAVLAGAIYLGYLVIKSLTPTS